jgi:hypothetical protein
MLCELRIGGDNKASQTVFPGSTHVSGEKIAWQSDGPPPEVSFQVLKQAVVELAVACVVTRGWKCGNRHEASLRLGGLLARVGWSIERIENFVGTIARAADDDDVDDRTRTARYAAEGYAQNENAYGLPGFKELFGNEEGDAVASWLGYREAEGDSDLEHMNERYCVVQVAGKVRVLAFEERSGSGLGKRYAPVFYTFVDFRNLLCNQTVRVGDATVPLAQWWLRHPRRREYRGLVFHPGAPAVVDGCLNLWRRWGVEPRPGEWGRMRHHIEEVLAGGDAALAEYIIKWTAWAFQHPGEVPEVALVFKGGKGAGKGIFGRALCEIFGQHGIQISSTIHLAGRFNAHLADCAMLFADEAYWPGDKSAEGTLKRLITEPRLFIERKGIDGFEVENCIHLVMASNDEWVVPASIDERRFVVSRVSDHRRGDAAYFAELVKELREGGLAAMLHDLLATDLGSWHPRQIVKTAALREQQQHSLSGEDEWWLGLLQEGVLPRHEISAHSNPRRARSCDLLDHARKAVLRLRHLSPHALGHYLRKRGCRLCKTDVRRWEFPPLREARALWDEELSGVEWSDAEEWELERM